MCRALINPANAGCCSLAIPELERLALAVAVALRAHMQGVPSGLTTVDMSTTCDPVNHSPDLLMDQLVECGIWPRDR